MNRSIHDIAVVIVVAAGHWLNRSIHDIAVVIVVVVGNDLAVVGYYVVNVVATVAIVICSCFCC